MSDCGKNQATKTVDAGVADARAIANAGLPKPKISLQKYLDKAYLEAIVAGKLGTQPQNDAIAKLHVPISMFALAKTGSNHEYAGIHDDEMHFSASLMKVAAMYAAFSLRAEAETLKRSPPLGGFSNQNAFFTVLSQQFNTADAVLAIRNAGVGLKPRYADILSVTGFGGATLQVKFTPSFQGHLHDMIVPSNNNSAGECIRRLGYAYINVKLMNGGFFDQNTSKGIWLAADFVGGRRVEIDSENDGKSAQATTSRQMARLFLLVQLGQLIDSISSSEMQQLLQEANTVDSSWLALNDDRTQPVVRKFNVDSVKIGLANLKPNTIPTGPNVYSEGVVIKWKGTIDASFNLNGEIAVCWQNLRQGNSFGGIAEIIEKAFSNFLNQIPI